MAQLGKDEREYCLRHGIPLDRLFDASGYTRASYKEIMGVEEKWAAYGVRACLNGHVLRNRHGSCLKCDPQTVAHMLRTKLPGYLYVAVESRFEFMKLGFSQDPANRIRIANYEAWGGYRDWRLIAQGRSIKAGKLEAELHAHFRESQVPLSWMRNGEFTSTKESFKADLPEAGSKLVWLCDGAPEMFY